MRFTPRAVFVAVSLACLSASGAAPAQDKEADAERLFREGQNLMEQRRFGEACPKFEAAYAKDRQLGTLLNLAFCHKEQGATWYAWLEFREAEVKAAEMKRTERRDFARERLNELEKSLPKVVLDVPKKLTLTDVLVEDRRVPEAERGAVFTAEEGKRKFTFRAKGKKSATVLIAIGAKTEKAQHLAVPEMEDGEDELPPKPQPQVIVVPAPAPAPAPPPSDANKSRPGSAQRTIAFTALGLAGAAVVVGSVTGIMTLTSACATNFREKDDERCSEGEKDSAKSIGMIADVSWIVAGAAATAGLVLLLTAPSASASAAAPRPARPTTLRPELGLGWAGLRGTF